MAKLKMNRWVSADKVRIVKRNGRKVLEVKRMVPVKKNPSRRKSKKAVKRGATSGNKAARKKQYASLRKEFGWK